MSVAEWVTDSGLAFPSDDIVQLPKAEDGGRDQQFITDEVYVDGAQIQYTAEFPTALNYPGFVFIVNGFGGYKATSRGLRSALADEGFVTCTATPPRVSDNPSWDDFRDSQSLHARVHAQVQIKLSSHPRLAKMPNADLLDADKALWLPHSMGGLSVARFVHESPDSAEGIVNLMAAGYGSPNLHRILWDVPRNLIPALRKELVPYLSSDYIDVDIKNLYRILSYYLHNPLRTVGEIRSCLNEDVRERIADVRSTGRQVGYIAAKYDCLVPEDPSIASHVDDYVVLANAGHLVPQLKPQLVARSAADLILKRWGLGF